MSRRWSLCVLLMLASAASVAQTQDKIRVVNEGGISHAWTLPPGSKLAVPAYPVEYADNQAEVCVAIGYLLNADGNTSDFALLKSWSAREPRQKREAYWGAFARAASTALSQWRFIPKPDVAVPRQVYTVATFVFASPNLRETSKRCAIPNLGQRLVELRHDNRARRRMSAVDVFDRLDLDPALEAHYLNNQRHLRDAEFRRKQPPATPVP